MNNYICTNFGFVKAIVFDVETRISKIEYTNSLRYAQAYNSKTAKNIMEKHDIIGFTYNPYLENHNGRDMYEVRRDNYSWENPDKLGEWKVVKAWSTNDSDAEFLRTRKLKADNYLTLEQAQAKAIELNRKMLHDLYNKLSEQIVVCKSTQILGDIMDEIQLHLNEVIITAEQNTCLHTNFNATV